jgi:hypothetical protein
MAHHFPPGMEQSIAALEAALWPRLQSAGVAELRFVVLGTPARADLYVGWRAAPGAELTNAQVHEVVSTHFPASVSYHMLQVSRIERLPETDPSILEAQRKIRRPTVGMVVTLGLLVSLPLAFLVGQFAFSRGELMVTAPLKGAGKSEARFVATGDSVALWASLDGAWTRNDGGKTHRKIMPVHYEIDVIREGKVAQHLSVDTREASGQLKLVCTVAPDCEVYLLDLPEMAPGPVLLQVEGKPRADVVRVDDMSINVRKATFF